MTNIFIMDNDSIFLDDLVYKFDNKSNFYVVGTATNGQDGLNFIKNFYGKIDILIIDLLLPIYDGITVINIINEKYRKKVKKIIITSSIFTTDTIKYLSEQEINYTLLKPYSFETCLDTINNVLICNSSNNSIKITEIYNYLLKNPDKLEIKISELKLIVEKEVTKILRNLGVKPNLQGFNYIRSSIIEVFFKRNTRGDITKIIYPEIAKQYNTTTSRVERSIRNAIHLCVDNGNYENILNIFGNLLNDKKLYPTNSEFILQLSDILRLNLEIPYSSMINIV